VQHKGDERDLLTWQSQHWLCNVMLCWPLLEKKIGGDGCNLLALHCETRLVTLVGERADCRQQVRVVDGGYVVWTSGKTPIADLQL